LCHLVLVRHFNSQQTATFLFAISPFADIEWFFRRNFKFWLFLICNFFTGFTCCFNFLSSLL
jgi:hypothetical protein